MVNQGLCSEILAEYELRGDRCRLGTGHVRYEDARDKNKTRMACVEVGAHVLNSAERRGGFSERRVAFSERRAATYALEGFLFEGDDEDCARLGLIGQ